MEKTKRQAGAKLLSVLKMESMIIIYIIDIQILETQNATVMKKTKHYVHTGKGKSSCMC